MGAHDAQRGAQVPPELLGAQSPPNRAGKATSRGAADPQLVQATVSGAGERTSRSSVRPQAEHWYSKSGTGELYPHWV